MLVTAAVGLVLPDVAHAQPTSAVRFNEQIRPLLSDRCFACHGPDGNRREADLRLDTRDGALAAKVIVAGDPDASELLKRIESTDPEVVMPPPHAKKVPLTPRERDLLRQWIREGAPYEAHWAFLPISRDPPPPSTDPEVRNPIDVFVRERLKEVGLTPSPEADRATLIRRLSLDLLGLLPSPEEVAEFIRDSRSDAYERLVDRLLASPHFGERWGRHWLDQARYADSNGYSIDGPRDMWPYRDWVIANLNADLPFDQFTIEQLAGDLLPSPTKTQLVATGFHRNTLINQEGGTDPEQFRVEAAMDRTNTTGAVWLGLTVGCAQCHTHKYDPLSQQEYYSLMAFFNSGTDVNSVGTTVEVVRGEMFGQPVHVPRPEPPPSSQQIAEWRTAWETATRTRLEAEAMGSAAITPNWQPLDIKEIKGLEGTEFERLEDGSALAVGPNVGFDNYRVLARSPLSKIGAIRLRVLPHESLPKTGPGRASNGNFVLTKVSLTLNGQEIGWAKATADHEQVNYPAEAILDDDSKTGWAINVPAGSTHKMNAPHEAILHLAAPLELPDGTPLEFMLKHELNRDYLIGRFALDAATEGPTGLAPGDRDLLAALSQSADQRTKEQQDLLQKTFEQAEPRARKRPPFTHPDLARTMVMKDLPQPRETFLLTRGDFTRPDRERGPLQPTVFAALAPKLSEGDAPRSRLDLARWLVDPEHPLTARVTVNRVWMRYFGRGLVETEEDFGTQGTPPSHPPLLDWLATEFQRQGWSQKALHRLIVTSATYRQSSRARADIDEIDPRNLLLGRQNRLRLDAEIVRDAALTASGRLDAVFGGKSVFPPQPDGVYSFTQIKKEWPTETGPARYRRTLYTHFYRSAPYPLLTTFDSPDFQSVCTRRLRSNTPLQALNLANDVMFLELAQGLAERVLAEVPGESTEIDATRLSRMMEHTCSRPPTPQELAILRQMHASILKDFAQDDDAAALLVTARLRETAGLAESAALVLVARTLFNTDNFITRE